MATSGLSTNLLDIIAQILLAPGVSFRLGTMMAIALVAGFLLYNDIKDMFKWAMLGVIYLGFQEWIRQVVSDTFGMYRYADVDTALVIIGSIMFTISLFVGAYIASRADRKLPNGHDAVAVRVIRQVIQCKSEKK